MRQWFRKSAAEQKAVQTDDELLAIINGTSGTYVDALTVPAVAAAVRLISEAAAVLDVNVLEGDKPLESHPALDLLRGQVNDWTSGYELIRNLVIEALTRDAGGLAWVNRRGDGQVVEVIHYRAGVIGFQEEETRELIYRLNGVLIPSSDVVHVRAPFGKSPVTLARRAILAAAAMEDHTKSFFSNSAQVGGIIEVPNGVGEDAIKRMKAGWRAAHEGPDRAGRTAILFSGATFRPNTMTSTDAQLIENKRWALEEIARAFGMSASQLGDLTKSSYANASHKQLELIIYVIEPWLCALESAFDRALLTKEERRTKRFRFARDDLTRASLTERATAINSLIASETINPNTGRSWLGLAPYEGGDAYGNRNITVKPAKADPISGDNNG